MPKLPRPRSVNFALLLMAGILAWFIWDAIGNLQQVQSGEESVIALVWHVVRMAIWMLLAVHIARGKNWARFGLLVLALFGVGSLVFDWWYSVTEMPAGVRLQVDVMSVVLSLAPHLVKLLALYLLFFPGRRWFRNHEVVQ